MLKYFSGKKELFFCVFELIAGEDLSLFLKKEPHLAKHGDHNWYFGHLFVTRLLYIIYYFTRETSKESAI